MSLALTALRLQAIAALNSHPVIRSLVGGRVYDSRISEFDYREPVPVITLTTEELSGEAWDEGNGGAPFNDACNLVLEVAMNIIVDQELADGIPPEPMIGAPATDAEMEAKLNLIAWAAENMLTLGRATPETPSTPEGQLLLKAVTRRCTKRTMSRFASDETGEKLAIQMLTFEVQLKGEERDNPLDPPTGEFATLPDPLRTVCESLPEWSSGAVTCRMLAAALTLPQQHRFNVGTMEAPPQLSPEEP